MRAVRIAANVASRVADRLPVTAPVFPAVLWILDDHDIRTGQGPVSAIEDCYGQAQDGCENDLQRTRLAAFLDGHLIDDRVAVALVARRDWVTAELDIEQREVAV